MESPNETKIIEASKRVYQQLGAGHNESIYHKALVYELNCLGYNLDTEMNIVVRYTDSQGHSHALTSERIDIFIHRCNIVLELKATSKDIQTQELAQIKKYFGVTVPKSTWDRWREWWRNVFVKTPFWQQHKGLCPPADENRGSLPRHLFCAFKNSLDKKMTQILKFLSPLTSGNLRAI